MIIFFIAFILVRDDTPYQFKTRVDMGTDKQEVIIKYIFDLWIINVGCEVCFRVSDKFYKKVFPLSDMSRDEQRKSTLEFYFDEILNLIAYHCEKNESTLTEEGLTLVAVTKSLRMDLVRFFLKPEQHDYCSGCKLSGLFCKDCEDGSNWSDKK